MRLCQNPFNLLTTNAERNLRIHLSQGLRDTVFLFHLRILKYTIEWDIGTF